MEEIIFWITFLTSKGCLSVEVGLCPYQERFITPLSCQWRRIIHGVMCLTNRVQSHGRWYAQNSTISFRFVQSNPSQPPLSLSSTTSLWYSTKYQSFQASLGIWNLLFIKIKKTICRMWSPSLLSRQCRWRIIFMFV